MSKQSKQAQLDLGNRIPSGYDGDNVPTDFEIPSCGIEDVDVALFKLFDRDNFINVLINDEEGNGGYRHKVPVVFATGERFAMRQRNTPIRDKSGSLILPIISIRRTGLNQEKAYMGGYGIGQNTGDLIIKKKLSARDREYQNLINKRNLMNQDNVASTANFLNDVLEQGNVPGRVASRREKLESTPDLLSSDELGSNIYEIISMPFPMFYVATYEVVIWTNFRQHMNEIVEKIMTNYDGQGRTYRIDTKKGYWFVAYFDDNIGNEDNVEEFSDQLKVHKTVFTINVPAYMIANKNGGDMVPFRKYLSSPQISFEAIDGIYEQPFVSKAPSGDLNKFILNDVNELEENGQKNEGREESFYERKFVKDPFTGKERESYHKIKYRNARAGETVISKKKLFDIDIP